MTTLSSDKKEEITDVTSYLKRIFEIEINNTAEVRCYRGHANAQWKLIPSVLRNLKPEAESRIISELTLEAPDDFGNDKSMFDKLVRAQHYGLPTRLLDVSLNPLVALYFACCEDKNKHAEIYIFDFNPKRVKFADSDTVSLISNLSRLSDNEKENLKKTREYIKDKEKIRMSDEMKRLTQFIRVEKPYFTDSVVPPDLFRYFFVYPLKNNKRVIAQSGAFITAGLLNYEKPDSSAGFKVKKVKIHHQYKDKIIKQLDLLNINSRTMFPEVESTSKYIKEKWMLENEGY